MVFLKNKHGNIFANLIKEPGTTVHHRDFNVFRSTDHYGEAGKPKLNLSLDTQRSYKKALLKANNPKQVEPTFLLTVGSKNTASDNFQ